MTNIFGVPLQALLGQLTLGLINGSFYALLSLGLAVIFGMLQIVNFAHGALYALGAFCALFLLSYLGLNYWWALVLAPLMVGVFGMAIEWTMLRRLQGLDPLYGLLLTFGIALVIQGLLLVGFGSSGVPYAMPPQLSGGINLGFMFLPLYRGWVIVVSLVVCLGTWAAIEHTRLGSYLRAGTENRTLVQAFGINVPLLIMLTYGFGVALAGFAGVLAAPIYQIRPLMGADLIVVVFAVVVIGGMGSIMGAIVTGFGLGLIEALTKTYYSPASNVVIFVIMAIVLLFKAAPTILHAPAQGTSSGEKGRFIALGVMVAALAIGPFVAYPFLLMTALCLALFACAFNLLLGYSGLLSFGHAMFLGGSSYICAHAASAWGLPPELALLCGIATAAVLGTVTGLLAIGRQGIYFAMITLALSQMVYFLALQAPFTRGEDGIQNVPLGKLFGFIDLSQPMTLYAVIAVLFMTGFLLIERIIRSPFGEVLKAIRDNEPRAISLGYRTERYKLMAFVLSASIAGLAGAMKALVTQNASLSDVHWTTSGEVVLMALLGGIGTSYGPVIGAFLIVGVQNYLGGSQWVGIVQGLIFIFCVMTFRRGIIGEIAKICGWRL